MNSRPKRAAALAAVEAIQDEQKVQKKQRTETTDGDDSDYDSAYDPTVGPLPTQSENDTTTNSNITNRSSISSSVSVISMFSFSRSVGCNGGILAHAKGLISKQLVVPPTFVEELVAFGDLKNEDPFATWTSTKSLSPSSCE